MTPLAAEPTSMRDLSARAVASFVDLLALHLALVRAEVTRDAARFAADIAPILLAVPLVLVGYAMLCVAAAIALQTFVGIAWSFAAIGVANVILGGGAVARTTMALRARSEPFTSFDELNRTSQAILGHQGGPNAS